MIKPMLYLTWVNRENKTTLTEKIGKLYPQEGLTDYETFVNNILYSYISKIINETENIDKIYAQVSKLFHIVWSY